MAVYKDNWNGYNGKTWRVACTYKDWTGRTKKYEKRGFKTKKEAAAHEREMMEKLKRNPDMGFSSFIDVYLADMKPQLKESTMANKENIINSHIRPCFQDKSLSEISPTDILQWQNEMLSKRDENGRGYSPSYLRSIQNQMNAIFNHAVRYYDLAKNPCLANKKMGKSKGPEMQYWTKEEYLKFSDAIQDKPISYYAFQLLYWTGIRCGEMLALTAEDFDLKARRLRINKTYQVVQGRALTTTPKTEKSNRYIDLPEFLCREMQDYFDSLYRFSPDSRLFPVSKGYMHHEMDRGCRISGVKRIRIHDLRHSACALLISLGYTPFEIGARLGHESTEITERYAHLFPSVQRGMAEKLDQAYKEESRNEG